MKGLLRFLKRNSLTCAFAFFAIIGAIVFLWFHRQPWTNNAFAVANVRPVSAYVPGYITNIYALKNQEVKKGDKLFSLYRDPYALTVAKLESQTLAARLGVTRAQTQLKKDDQSVIAAQAALDNAKYLATQAADLSIKQAVSQKDAETLLRASQEAEADLAMATTQKLIDQQELAIAEANVKGLEAELLNAKINLEETTVFADTDGIVTNLYVGVGTYVTPGQSVCAFVETGTWWIQANFKETEIGDLRPGQKALVRLWMYPNVTFEGEVDRIGWNVNRQQASPFNHLEEVQPENEWFLLPQRFPVLIRLTRYDREKYPLHTGASASVTVQVNANEFRQLLWIWKTN